MIQLVCLLLFQLAGCKQKNTIMQVSKYQIPVCHYYRLDYFNTLKGQLFDENNKGSKKNNYEIEEVYYYSS